MRSPDSSRPATEQRVLPVRPDTYTDEWLQSALSRWAWSLFGCSRRALLGKMGLADVPLAQIVELGTAINDDLAVTLSAATDISVPRLRAMTMSRFDGSLLMVASAVPGHVKKIVDGGWTRRSGTRFCSSCLEERPGVFEMSWRLTWSYLCLRHLQLLDDNCPNCHQPPRDQTGRHATPHDPARCFVPTDALGQSRCQAFLSDTPANLRFDAQAAVVDAQKAVLGHMHSDRRQDLTATMGVLRSAGRLELIADLSGVDHEQLLGLIEAEQRQGSKRPNNALAMAALTTSAGAILSMPPEESRSLMRELTFARPPGHVPRSAGLGPGSPNEITARWGHPSPQLRRRILHAVYRDLTPRHRIEQLSALSEDELDQGELRRDHLMDYVPQLFWASWSVPLHGPQPVNHSAFRLAISSAFSGRSAKSHDLRATMLGTAEQTTALVRTLSLLSIEPLRWQIDYRRRTLLPWSDFLAKSDWIAVAEAASFNPGSQRRYHLARRYMAMRLTGSDRRALPFDPSGQASRQDAADFTAFSLQISRTLQLAMDAYLRAFLDACSLLPRILGPLGTGSTRQLSMEPVTWSPPRGVVPVGPNLGRELDDINLPHAHQLLEEGHRLSRVSQLLHRPAWHVQLALDAQPGGTQSQPGVVNWAELGDRIVPGLPPEPTRAALSRQQI